MRNFRRVIAIYRETDSILGRLESDARRRKRKRDMAKHQRQRRTSDHAHFVLLFASFEDHVNDRCRSLILRKQGLRNWVDRRAWQVFDPNDLSRTSFRNRLSLLLDRSGSDFSRISNYYEIRNDLAHQGGTSHRFVMSIVARDLEAAARRFRR